MENKIKYELSEGLKSSWCNCWFGIKVNCNRRENDAITFASVYVYYTCCT